MDYLAVSAEEHAISFRWRPFLPDPDDDFVLELAIAAGQKAIQLLPAPDWKAPQSLDAGAAIVAVFAHSANLLATAEKPSIRLWNSTRYNKWINTQTIHAGHPQISTPKGFATAAARPITAISPRSEYANGPPE